MTIKARLTILAVISISSIIGLVGLKWYHTTQIDNKLREIEQISRFKMKSAELSIQTEQYLAYAEERYSDSWDQLYSTLNSVANEVNALASENVVQHSLVSVENAFDLIRDIYRNPENYPDRELRERLQDRATARIRSDIQMLIAASHTTSVQHHKRVRALLVDQRIDIFYFLIPVVLLITFITILTRRRIVISLSKLLKGTQQIAEGDLDAQINIESSDEHGRLADKFNYMTRRLKEHIIGEKKARKQAEENQKLWEKLVYRDPNLVMITINGVVNFINPAGAKMYGMDDPEKLIGRQAIDLLKVSGQQEEARERIYQLQREKRTTGSALYQIHDVHGNLRYIRLESVPIQYKGKDAIQSVGVDFTDHINYENQLKRSLEEQKTLLKEIHHRVKNNLAVVSGLLQMQRHYSDNEELSGLLEESERRIRSIADVHESLYLAESLSQIRMNEYIEHLVNLIQTAQDPEKEVQIRLSVEKYSLNISQAVPCALILNEVISNTYKHAFTDKHNAVLNIECQIDGEEVKFTIQDNGKGVPDDFSLTDSPTLGITLIDLLTKQLDGSIDIKPGKDKGTVVKFSFVKHATPDE